MCANPRFTLITATNPSILTKKFHLAQDGRLVKTPGGPLITGLAKQVPGDADAIAAVIWEPDPKNLLMTVR